MNIVKLLKNWTLPVAIATGIVIYLLFHFVPLLHPIASWYYPYNNSIQPVFMFMVLFVTFCKVDFKQLMPVKWHLWTSLQQVLFVLILIGIVEVFGLRGHGLILLEAVLVCIICPCASASAVVTAKLGGSLEEMTTYTFLSNLISVLIIPISFPLLPQSNGESLQVDFVPFFMHILWQVSVVLLLPMVVAYVVKHHFHRFHHRITNVSDLSYYLWGCSLVLVSGTTTMNILDAEAHTSLWPLLSIAFLSLVLCIIQFVTGRFIGRKFDRVIESGQSLGQKNTVFAIWIATVFLNPLASVGPGCYILWQNIINSFEIWMYRRKGLEHTC